MKIYGFRLGFHRTFVPKVRINNIPTQVQIMAWRQPGDKPSSGLVMVTYLRICVIRAQWVNTITAIMVIMIGHLLFIISDKVHVNNK